MATIKTAHSPLPWAHSDLTGEDYFTAQTERQLREGEEPVLLPESANSIDDRKSLLPWWKRPSPGWLMPGLLVMAACLGACIGPRLEIYSLLVCRSIDSPTNHGFSTFDGLPDIGGTPVMANPWIPNWLVAGELDPNTCRHDARVSKKVAALNTAMILCMGILSALTTGFYGAISDRHGRTRVLALSLLGLAANDCVFLTTVHFVDKVGYKFLLVGPIIEGLLGGMATATAANNGYISDCTSAGSRARIFSVLTGAMFLGFGLGPTLGALLIRATNNVIAPFYITMAAYLLIAMVVIFLVPESLSAERQAESRLQHEKTVQASRAKTHSPFRRSFNRIFRFLRPLALFFPRKTEDAHPDGVHIMRSNRKPGKRDYSLTLVAAAYGVYAGMYAIMSIKMLYSQHKFGWGPVEIGYLLTLLGGCRVVFLLAVLPLAIKLFKRPRKNQPSPSRTETSPLLDHSKDMTDDELVQEAHRVRVLHDSHFDLNLARVSLVIDISIYLGLVFQTSPAQFVTISALQALAGGAGPALQSLALALCSPKDAGALFSALSVLQTLMAQVLGPFIYGLLYTMTVDIFPETIFAVGAGLFIICLICLLSIRLQPQ